jgi:serine/threonine protein kinase
MDSRQVLARFEAERQALALMDHPSIATVLDGGLHDGRPFFVMELVKGVPITDYCDTCRLTPRERLELFVPVCQAIQHAHQKGVIHRDIKPSNVLVALYDDRPVVKVIDFGVAKATGGTLTERTIDTGFGGVVRTPEYMSPEQATFNNLDIDSPQFAGMLAQVSLDLLGCGQPAAAEPLLRECLTIREKRQPDAWNTFNTRSMLGGALLGQRKYAEAEPFLLKGYEGMKGREKTIPPQGLVRLPEAADRLVELYTALGKPGEAARWRAERAEYPPPTAPPPRAAGR